MNESGSVDPTNDGIGSHHSPDNDKNEWLTPPWLVEELGPFDLDPCAAVEQPWDTAETHHTIHDNGLSTDWTGRVWCNPPYGQQTGRWLNRLQQHGDGIALVFARTETDMFFGHVWNDADGLLFIKSRLYFHHGDGTKSDNNAGGPSVLVAYGKNNVRALRDASIDGSVVTDWSMTQSETDQSTMDF